MNVRLPYRFAVLMAAIGLTTAASAASMAEMQGAWAMDGTDCAAVFEKKGSEIRFKDPGSSLDTGIIVSGNKVARVALQKEPFGASHAWVLPNPSGLNAHYQPAALAQLFGELRVWAIAEHERRRTADLESGRADRLDAGKGG